MTPPSTPDTIVLTVASGSRRAGGSNGSRSSRNRLSVRVPWGYLKPPAAKETRQFRTVTPHSHLFRRRFALAA